MAKKHTSLYIDEALLADLDAVQLAAIRGQAMSAACALTPTGMSAVMGGDTDAVLAAVRF